LFQQSTRKCKWESYEARNKFVEEMGKRQMLARARGYGPDYVASFIEKRKKDMREYARQNHIPTPFSVWEAKHLAERERREWRRRGQGRLHWRSKE
jgi:hypothetical protein